MGLLEGTAKMVGRRAPALVPLGPSVEQRVQRPLSAPPALGLRRQGPVWPWTAPMASTSMHAYVHGQQPVPMRQMQWGAPLLHRSGQPWAEWEKRPTCWGHYAQIMLTPCAAVKSN